MSTVLEIPLRLGFATAVQYRNPFIIGRLTDDWVSRPETLTVPRDNCAAFMLPDDAEIAMPYRLT